jgi:hypothetical protein
MLLSLLFMIVTVMLKKKTSFNHLASQNLALFEDSFRAATKQFFFKFLYTTTTTLLVLS